MALCQLTSLGWQASAIRRTPTHDSDFFLKMHGQHKLWEPAMGSEGQIKDKLGEFCLF